MLTETNVAYIEQRMEAIKETIVEHNHLVTDEDVVSDRIFFSSVCNENLLKTINSIYFEVNTHVVSKVIKYNLLVNNEL